MSRIKAFLIHFCLSFLVVSTCVAIVFVVWYPDFYFYIFDAAGVLKILVGVDLVLGPALTLLLFKPGKPGLYFDLSVIASLQIVALVYGLYVVYTERPYFTVFVVDRFEVLTLQDVDIDSVDPALLNTNKSYGPVLVVAELPSDPAELQSLMEETLFLGKPDIQKRPEFWRAFGAAADAALGDAPALTELLGRNPAAEADIQALLDSQEGGQSFVYVPIMGKHQVFSLVLNRTTWEPVGLIDLDPWEPAQQLSAAP